MNRTAAVALALALAACAEITTFRQTDGTVFHYVDCESSLRLLESCRHAALRICPRGYHALGYEPSGDDLGEIPYRRCLEDNGDLPAAELAKACVRAKSNEGFFACD